MGLKPFAIALSLLTLAAAPAAAAPFCTGLPTTPGLHISFGVSIGGSYSEKQSNEFDLMELRRRGVDATDVERVNGCLRAYVRNPNGIGERMEYYEPGSYRRVL